MELTQLLNTTWQKNGEQRTVEEIFKDAKKTYVTYSTSKGCTPTIQLVSFMSWKKDAVKIR